MISSFQTGFSFTGSSPYHSTAIGTPSTYTAESRHLLPSPLPEPSASMLTVAAAGGVAGWVAPRLPPVVAAACGAGSVAGGGSSLLLPQAVTRSRATSPAEAERIDP